MKNIDKVKLGERLLDYFKKQGCEVHVFNHAQYTGHGNTQIPPHLVIEKFSPQTFRLGKFQQMSEVWRYTSFSSNINWEKFMKEIVNEYYNCKMSSSQEFVNANSPEELDLKLAINGF